jgi:hypothetical protein
MDETSLKAAMDEFLHDMRALIAKHSHKNGVLSKDPPTDDPDPPAGGLNREE